MAVPTVEGVGTAVAGVGNVSPGIPTHQANDILLVFVEAAESAGASAPANWAHITNSPRAQGSNVTSVNVLWRRATGAGHTITVTDPGNHAVAVAMVVRGCVTSGDPWDFSPVGTGGTAVTSFAVSGGTTTVADCLAVVAVASNIDTLTDQFSSVSNGSLTSFTERAQDFTDQGNGGGIAVYTGSRASTGTTGTTNGTIAASSSYSALAFALKPATAANITGTASLVGEGTISAIGVWFRGGSASLTGNGTLTATGSRRVAGSTSLTGNGTTTAAGTRRTFGSASLTGNGTTTASGHRNVTGTAALTGNGTASAAGVRKTFGAASLAGNGTLTAAGAVAGTGSGTASLVGNGTLTAVGKRTVHGSTSLVGELLLFADSEWPGGRQRTGLGTWIVFGGATLVGTGTLTAVGSGEVETVTGTASLVGNLDLTAAGFTVIPSDTPAARILVVPRHDRRVTVPSHDRTITVPAHDRSIAVPT